MITYVDLAPLPTVHVFLSVPVAIDGDGWTWGELGRFAGPLAREYAYSARECAALVRTYGTTMARLIQPKEADRFCIYVRGPVTGLLLHRAEWKWDQRAHTYKPDGEPWCGWRPAAKAYFERTGELIDSKRFCPHMALIPTPHTPSLTRAA